MKPIVAQKNNQNWCDRGYCCAEDPDNGCCEINTQFFASIGAAIGVIILLIIWSSCACCTCCPNPCHRWARKGCSCCIFPETDTVTTTPHFGARAVHPIAVAPSPQAQRMPEYYESSSSLEEPPPPFHARVMNSMPATGEVELYQVSPGAHHSLERPASAFPASVAKVDVSSKFISNTRLTRKEFNSIMERRHTQQQQGTFPANSLPESGITVSEMQMIEEERKAAAQAAIK